MLDFFNDDIKIIFFIVAGFIPVVLTLTFVYKLKKRRAKEILAKFDEKDLLGATDRANFFGIKSKGLRQIRGNGILILTKDLLFFEYLMPKRAYEIPISSIIKIETPRSFLGRSMLKQLLKVSFITNGKKDQVAWFVPELDRWVEALEKLTENNR